MFTDGAAVKFHPVLFPASVEVVPAYQVSNGVAFESLMLKYPTLTVLVPVYVNVLCVPAELELIVIKLPAVPFTLKSATVVVVLAGKVMVAGCTVLVMSANVFAPVITNAPAPPWLSVGYENPPPANVLDDALVMLIVPVPLVVWLVPDAVNVAPDTDIVPPLKAIDLVNAPVDDTAPVVNVLAF